MAEEKDFVDKRSKKMIAVIENKDFVEAVFKDKKKAEKYLLDHPQKEICVLKDIKADNFPFYNTVCKKKIKGRREMFRPNVFIKCKTTAIRRINYESIL